MFNKILSLLLIFGLIATTNLSVFAQTQSSELKNSQRTQTLSKKEFFNYSERSNDLLERDAFIKVNKDSITEKTMRDADKARQKKKFSGINTTTAIIIGGVLAAAIIIVLAAKGGNDKPSGQVYCTDIRSPCP